MKTLNMLFILALIAMLFGGCAKDDDPNFAELLKGTWGNTTNIVFEIQSLDQENLTYSIQNQDTGKSIRESLSEQ